MKEEKGYKFRKRLTRLLISVFILFLFIGFNFQDTRVGSWNPQYIYNTNGKSLIDFAFADSLTGYIVLRKLSIDYPSSILKTTNGGDNWFISKDYPSDSAILQRINLINKDSVLICEGFSLIKTTNGGQIWIRNNFPGFLGFDIHAFNLDTIWIGAGTGFNQPQLYLTTNGGINWTLKFQLPSGVQFDKVYFYNKRIGFCSTSSNTYKTTNGGENWFQIMNQPFSKMQFVDSLTGWKCGTAMKKTTDGGYNWITQILPSGENISLSWMLDFCILNRDTIWGCGGDYYYPSVISNLKGVTGKSRGMIWKTTNGGLNWGYQIPDTSLVSFNQYYHICFYNKLIGWVYAEYNGGVHTTTGGLDTTVYIGINNNSAVVTKDFVLYQNYPNPFNQCTIINVQCTIKSYLKIKIFDISGRKITTLMNEKKSPGKYEVKFNGENLSSGIYFYSLYADGERVGTKRMIVVK